MTDWIVVRESGFVRQYKKLGGPRQNRVEQAVRELETSDNPTYMGRYKKTVGAFAYEIGRSDRLIYRIELGSHELILVRVCDHKSTYGTD